MQSAQTSVHSAAQGPAVKTMSPDASAISIRAEWQSLCMNTWQSHYERLFLTSTQWGFWWLQSFCEVVSCAWKMIQHILRQCALHTLFTPCHVIYTAVHFNINYSKSHKSWKPFLSFFTSRLASMTGILELIAEKKGCVAIQCTTVSYLQQSWRQCPQWICHESSCTTWCTTWCTRRNTTCLPIEQCDFEMYQARQGFKMIQAATGNREVTTTLCEEVRIAGPRWGHCLAIESCLNQASTCINQFYIGNVMQRRSELRTAQW